MSFFLIIANKYHTVDKRDHLNNVVPFEENLQVLTQLNLTLMLLYIFRKTSLHQTIKIRNIP